MKIIKKGTFNKQGMPIFWQINCEGLEKYTDVKGILKIEDGKVFVGNIEIEGWTQERLNIMNAVDISDGTASSL